MGGVSQPSQLTPADQDALVKQIGIALMRAAPQEWQQIRTEYRAAGRYYELTTEVVDESGVSSAWTASHDIAMLFAKLRAGMHGERGGTWFNARYQIDRPSRYNLEFDRNEPHWRTPPPLQAYRDELHFFPRNDDDVPEWLMRRLSGLRPEQPGRRFRIARIFDGRGPSGRPSVNRPPVEDEEKQRLLDYLDRAPMILPERGHDIDRLSPDGGQNVPVAFQCDGIWIWPAAVNYYLRHYGLPPEPGLVENARANEFVSPEIDEGTANEAAANITGGRPPGPPPPRPPEGALPPGPPGEPGTEPPAPPMAAPPPAEQSPAEQPPAAMPRHRPTGLRETPEEADEAIAALRRRLAELGVSESAYRIGTPEPDTWFLEQLDDGWQVGWYHDTASPMVFDDAADATAYLLGKLLLEARESSGRHGNSTGLFESELTRPPEPELDARPAPAAPLPPPPPAFEPEPEPTVHAERNGGGRHDDIGIRDAGIRAAAASANVDLAAHGYDQFDRQPFGAEPMDTDPLDRQRLDHDPGEPDRLDREPLDQEPLDRGPLGREPLDRDPLDRDPLDPMNREPLGREALDREAPERDPLAHEQEPAVAEPLEQELFTHQQSDGGPSGPEDDRVNGAHETAPSPLGTSGLGSGPSGMGPSGTGPSGTGPSDMGPSGFGPPGSSGAGAPSGLGGPKDPAARAAALSTPTMVGASPVEAPAHSGGSRQAGAPAQHGAAGAAEEQASPQWEIQPLAGEPPLTLFRGKRMTRLSAGTEIDRFGDENGNLTYLAGIPFAERSLVPEWVNRPYHVYELTEPLEVLTGIAIPWFEQPGGGTAYLLPNSVEELLDSGELVEIEVDGHP